MSIDLIPAALVHAELLAGMHRICFAEPWSAASMAELLAMPGAFGLIAVDDAAIPGPAGFVLWRVAAGEAEILTIAVLPPWRRRGLGASLLEAASTAAAAEVMFLEVAADNAAAQALYLSQGFARVGLRKGYYGAIDALVLKKELSAISSFG